MGNDPKIPGIRREFIDEHIFYDGRYVSTELLTAMLEDYSRPRPMTADERAAFLSEYFSLSGW
jgi:poly-gamma-glutamate synthesis protein (capsule biosynthesis protein)